MSFALLRILHNVTGCPKSKMAADKPETNNNSNIRLHRSVFAAMPLRSWSSKPSIQSLEFRSYLVQKLRYKYFRFSGRHLEFFISGYIGQYRHQCRSVPGPRKHRPCHWNFDAISSRSRDTSTYGFGIRHLEFTDFRLHRTVSASVPFSSWTQKPSVQPLEFRFYLVQNRS